MIRYEGFAKSTGVWSPSRDWIWSLGLGRPSA